mmetsp:Transcript_13107/g.40924  ORF Transcript_13107/g.40924 Transcript_13107/m.40924 type:complete len:211 (-) Transcript_13107:839-1471(-)
MPRKRCPAPPAAPPVRAATAQSAAQPARARGAAAPSAPEPPPGVHAAAAPAARSAAVSRSCPARARAAAVPHALLPPARARAHVPLLPERALEPVSASPDSPRAKAGAGQPVRAPAPAPVRAPVPAPALEPALEPAPVPVPGRALATAPPEPPVHVDEQLQAASQGAAWECSVASCPRSTTQCTSRSGPCACPPPGAPLDAAATARATPG